VPGGLGLGGQQARLGFGLDFLNRLAGLTRREVEAFADIDPHLADLAGMNAQQVAFAVEQETAFPEGMVHP
jgi:hypothetical protein